jgi:ERCC4-type nuclease
MFEKIEKRKNLIATLHASNVAKLEELYRLQVLANLQQKEIGNTKLYSKCFEYDKTLNDYDCAEWREYNHSDVYSAKKEIHVCSAITQAYKDFEQYIDDDISQLKDSI